MEENADFTLRSRERHGEGHKICVVFCGDKYTAEMNQNKDKNAYTGPVPFHRFKLLLFDLLVCCASVRNSKSFQLGTVNYSIHSYDFN